MTTWSCSSRLLHSGDIIDQTYQTRRVLSLALARQWFGIHIVQKSWADAWLIYGLANLMGALFIKRHLGNSEFRLRMKRVSYQGNEIRHLYSLMMLGYGAML